MTTTPDDGYIPREITRYEYEMVCDASQNFTETYEHYCNRIHEKEHAEYLDLKNHPDVTELMSTVTRGLDGRAQLVTFFVARHYLGNYKCTRKYIPSYLDEAGIAEVGEETFREAVSKYDGKEVQDLV